MSSVNLNSAELSIASLSLSTESLSAVFKSEMDTLSNMQQGQTFTSVLQFPSVKEILDSENSSEMDRLTQALAMFSLAGKAVDELGQQLLKGTANNPEQKKTAAMMRVIGVSVQAGIEKELRNRAQRARDNDEKKNV